MGYGRRRIQRSLEKNLPEVKALVRGRMPAFVTSPRPSPELDDVPVFVFHDVTEVAFEAQLRYLAANGYTGLAGDRLLATIGTPEARGRHVALTFDDANWTFWAHAFPLLREYGFPATLFVVPGLVPEDDTYYPSLDDVRTRRPDPADDPTPEGSAERSLDAAADSVRRGVAGEAASLEGVAAPPDRPPLCTWRELRIMGESGLVDVQSHSLTHQRVPVSARVVDFVSPEFDPYLFGNVQVPVSVLEDESRPERRLRWGMPVFESAPRLSGRPRFVESRTLVTSILDHVADRGGERFFSEVGWRRELTARIADWPHERRGAFESRAQTEVALRREIEESKRMIEARIPGVAVDQFCYPWFIGGTWADRVAADAGYRAVHYGLDLPPESTAADRAPTRVARISEEYLFRLPGSGRRAFRTVWVNRIRRRMR